MQMRRASHTAPASPHDASHRRRRLIHQELSLCPHLTVAENILLGREPSPLGHLPAHGGRAHSRSIVLASFSHPDLKPNRLVGDAAAGRAAGRRDLPRHCRARAASC